MGGWPLPGYWASGDRVSGSPAPRAPTRLVRAVGGSASGSLGAYPCYCLSLRLPGAPGASSPSPHHLSDSHAVPRPACPHPPCVTSSHLRRHSEGACEPPPLPLQRPFARGRGEAGGLLAPSPPLFYHARATGSREVRWTRVLRLIRCTASRLPAAPPVPHALCLSRVAPEYAALVGVVGGPKRVSRRAAADVGAALACAV